MNTESKRCVVAHEDIYARGYGITPQAVMFDVNLSVKSKALYAYFCSFTGAGHHVFPSRETILSDLKLSKDAYYNALNPLIEEGYLRIEKARGFINKNMYVIDSRPNKVNTRAMTNEDDDVSTLSFGGINANGFGMIPKIIMCDEHLNITTKALLAFFYSLAASGACAFPQRSIILNSLNISKDTYYKALNLAVERGYITIKSRRSKNGRFNVNNYVLEDKPQPCPKNQDNEKNEINTSVSPCPEKQDNTETNRVLKNRTIPCPEKQDNNNIIFNNISNITTSNLIVSTPTMHTNKIQDWIMRATDYERYRTKLIPETMKSDNPHIRAIGESGKIYLKVVENLVKMANADKPQSYNKQKVDKKRFIASLQCCTVDKSLVPLVEEIVEHYEIVLAKYEVRYPNEYLKPIIWQHIENFNFNTDWWCAEIV